MAFFDYKLSKEYWWIVLSTWSVAWLLAAVIFGADAVQLRKRFLAKKKSLNPLVKITWLGTSVSILCFVGVCTMALCGLIPHWACFFTIPAAVCYATAKGTCACVISKPIFSFSFSHFLIFFFLLSSFCVRFLHVCLFLQANNCLVTNTRAGKGVQKGK